MPAPVSALLAALALLGLVHDPAAAAFSANPAGAAAGSTGWAEVKSWQTGIGALVGSLGGLLAILGGALYNAALTRDRDDRLRREDARSLAIALHGELLAIVDSFERHLKTFDIVERNYAQFQGKSPATLAEETVDVEMVPDVSKSIFMANAGRLGLLRDVTVIADVAQFYASSAAQGSQSTTVRLILLAKACAAGREAARVAIPRATHIAGNLEALADDLR